MLTNAIIPIICMVKRKYRILKVVIVFSNKITIKLCKNETVHILHIEKKIYIVQKWNKSFQKIVYIYDYLLFLDRLSRLL